MLKSTGAPIFIILCLSLLGCTGSEKTHQKTSEHDAKSLMNVIKSKKFEVPPTIIGGSQALYRHVSYPDEARKNYIQGRVIVAFVVTKKGRAKHFHIIKGLGYGCDRQAISALQTVRFRPAKVDGKPVEVQFYWSVVFRLNN